MNNRETIGKMTLEEKIALCSGQSFWTTKAYPQYGIPALLMCDGPHGLRKQTGKWDHMGLHASVKSTCFPAACTGAATWDVELMEEMGRAIGMEAVDEDVNIVLGPGANMKRNQLCGRNFEYFSEDPCLAGKLAAAWINGCQSTGTGASLKHFALNNQELKRMTTNVLVDERALHEYYLPAFETAVKEAQPATVMCAYNKIEGVYCSDNVRLLWDILRDKWGYGGAVVTDWGAAADRIAGFRAGLDLEMPGSRGRFDREVKAAALDGSLDEKYIDAAAERMLALIERTSKRDHSMVPPGLHEANHELARKVAAAGAVLLKNEDGILPLKQSGNIAVVGELARTPRYQGTGSSLVTPTRLVSLLDGVASYAPGTPFAPGYTIDDPADEVLMEQAVSEAEKADTVILCMGLTDIFESEGFDREHMRLPQNQTDLLDAITGVNKNVVVVLVGGSAVELPWTDKVKAIMHMQLAGQAGGQAAADLLYGRETPGGRLAESYPVGYADVVNSGYYDVVPQVAPYMESMYCGYRYFTTARVPVKYPFGYGLSYTAFGYSGMRVTQEGLYDFSISVTVKNTGDYDGAEVVQLYVEPHTNGVYRPLRELKAFAKVFLAPGEEKDVTLALDMRGFAVYDTASGDWVVEAGEYALQLGKNCEEIIVEQRVSVEGVAPQRSDCSEWYYTPKGAPQKSDFLTIHPPYEEYVPAVKGTYTQRNSIMEMKETNGLCKLIYWVIERVLAKGNGGRVDYNNVHFKMLISSVADNPVYALALLSPQLMNPKLAQFLVDASNGQPFAGLARLIFKK